jgi:hypothetical protein
MMQGGFSGAGFSLWGFDHAITKIHRLKPAPLNAEGVLRGQRKPVNAERRIPLFHNAGKLQISDSLGELALLQMLHDHAPIRGDQWRFSKSLQRTFVFAIGGVRRIEKNKLCMNVASLQAFDRARDIHAENFCFRADFERLQIAANQSNRRRMLLHKNRMMRATAKRFDANGSSPRIEIHKRGPAHCRSQYIEQRLPQAVARRAQHPPF